MTKLDINFQVEVYQNLAELKEEDAALLLKARLETKNAYSPYSNFQVGAVAKFINGEMVRGTNQENAAYPAGICAERTLMSTAAILYPGVGMETIAISYHNLNGKSNRPIGPCGICRQSFAEFQMRTGTPIRAILGGMEGEIYVIENIANLLPLGFDAEAME